MDWAQEKLTARNILVNIGLDHKAACGFLFSGFSPTQLKNSHLLSLVEEVLDFERTLNQFDKDQHSSRLDVKKLTLFR